MWALFALLELSRIRGIDSRDWEFLEKFWDLVIGLFVFNHVVIWVLLNGKNYSINTPDWAEIFDMKMWVWCQSLDICWMLIGMTFIWSSSVRFNYCIHYVLIHFQALELPYYSFFWVKCNREMRMSFLRENIHSSWPPFSDTVLFMLEIKQKGNEFSLNSLIYWSYFSSSQASYNSFVFATP